jgi:hypothetical protein
MRQVEDMTAVRYEFKADPDMRITSMSGNTPFGHDIDVTDLAPGRFPVFGQNDQGQVTVDNWVDPTGQLPDVASSTNKARVLTLPFTGEHGIFTRYLSEDAIVTGKGKISKPHGTILPIFGDNVFEAYQHYGVGTASGFYEAEDGTRHLLISMGSGVVLYSGLPSYNGQVWLDYFGDTAGLRKIDVVPQYVRAELLQDLNEAFKMLTKL